MPALTPSTIQIAPVTLPKPGMPLPNSLAHVEGSFGLLAQKVPPIDLDTRDPHALATPRSSDALGRPTVSLTSACGRQTRVGSSSAHPLYWRSLAAAGRRQLGEHVLAPLQHLTGLAGGRAPTPTI